jgi:hypothetical protein
VEINERDGMIDVLCSMSDRQVDSIVKPRLQAIKGRPNSEVLDEFMGIIDDCVYSALTSDFEIRVMHVMWLNMGGTEESLTTRNQLLGKATLEQKVDLQNRFKWKCRPLIEV